MLKVEGDLEKSKHLREEQIKNSNHQMDDLKSSQRKKVIPKLKWNLFLDNKYIF